MAKFVSLGCLAAVLYASHAYAAVPCESLASTALPNSTITMAQVVAAGTFVVPAAPRGGRDLEADREADLAAAEPTEEEMRRWDAEKSNQPAA